MNKSKNILIAVCLCYSICITILVLQDNNDLHFCFGNISSYAFLDKDTYAKDDTLIISPAIIGIFPITNYEPKVLLFSCSENINEFKLISHGTYSNDYKINTDQFPNQVLCGVLVYPLNTEEYATSFFVKYYKIDNTYGPYYNQSKRTIINQNFVQFIDDFDFEKYLE